MLLASTGRSALVGAAIPETVHTARAFYSILLCSVLARTGLDRGLRLGICRLCGAKATGPRHNAGRVESRAALRTVQCGAVAQTRQKKGGKDASRRSHESSHSIGYCTINSKSRGQMFAGVELVTGRTVGCVLPGATVKGLRDNGQKAQESSCEAEMIVCCAKTVLRLRKLYFDVFYD